MGRCRRQLQTYPSDETTAGISKRCNRKLQPEEDGGGEVGCSGKSCNSCTGRVIADCVAVCCCPCAIVNFFTLTFLKLPWMMGRKCLSSNKNKKKKLENNVNVVGVKDVVISRKDHEQVEEINGDDHLGMVTAAGIEEEGGGGISSGKYSARFEAERVWLELYRVDNLGFGRVSFNGIHSLG